MRQATIIRHKGPDDEGTFGVWTSDKGFQCHTVELPWRENARGLSCIPEGEYICEWRDSPLHGMVWRIDGVAGRDAILIHKANFAGDVERGFVAQVQGCIAPGMAIAVFAKDSIYSKSHPPLPRPQRGVVQSGLALMRLQDDLRDEHKFKLTITREQ